MKFLLKVGDQLDLNASWDGGAVDGVEYESLGSGVVSVAANGVVTANGLGTSVVKIKSSGSVIGSVVFEVLSSADFNAQSSLRDGSKNLVVDFAEVPQGPTLLSVVPNFTTTQVQTTPNGVAYYSQNGYLLAGSRISYYGMWQGGNDLENVVNMWDGNSATELTMGGSPTQLNSTLVMPTEKVVTQIQFDLNDTTPDGTVAKLYAQPTSNQYSDTVLFDGEWVQLGTDISMIANGTLSVQIPNTTPYRKYRIWMYTHYSPARIDCSAIRLYA